jgi:hypothetical protein
LDLSAQIRSVLGFLLVVALLLWLERVAASGFTALLNKFGAAGFFPLQIEVNLFLAGRGGGGGGGRVCCRSSTSGRPWRRGGVEALGGFFCIMVVVLRLRVSAFFSSVRPWWCGRRWSADSALWRFE